MTADNLQLGLVVVVGIALVFACLFVMFGVWNRTAPKSALAATDKAVADIDGRVHTVEQEIATLKTQISHLPSKDDVHALDKSLLQLASVVDRVAERVDSAKLGVERIENYLLNQPTPAPADRNHA